MCQYSLGSREWPGKCLVCGMRFYRALLAFTCVLTFGSLSLPFTATTAYAQETTAGLQGSIKDSTGAVIPNAKVTISSPTLVGDKTTLTDKQGNYRFANLPPGPYVVNVTASGFTTLRREGLILEVGHLPTVDLTVAVGGESTVVEVSASSPAIDVTSNTTLTNITQDVVQEVPHGRSYQSVIQFAPMARNEPLMGNTTTNGTGSVSAGNGSNGLPYGYSVGGGSDSENSYLVEGQATANLIGGYSHTNVPFDFIQEVEIKSSGIEAEHGGALGGVVNVIMKKGTPKYHGSVFIQFENQAMDAGPNAISGYDPNGTQTITPWGALDPNYAGLKPVHDKNSDVFPGFTFGGPLLPMFSRMRDRLFFFAAFNPELVRVERKINYGTAAEGGSGLGILPFSQNTNTYYTTARIDAKATERIRVFGSWLYQFQRQNGKLPYPDSVNGILNQSTGCFGAATSASNPCSGSGNAPSTYAHTLGYIAPNMTVNTGADITVSHNIVSTTRFGYYFENYQDFGFPTAGVGYQFQTNGSGGLDAFGHPLPSSLQQGIGSQNLALDANTTSYNSNKAIQLDEGVSFFKSGWAGTHNFKFGYQLNRLSNLLSQAYNVPYVQIFPGQSPYAPSTTLGGQNCATLIATYGACQGQYGYVVAQDIGTGGKAISYNHGLFAQDSWQLAHGVTLNLGLRVEKEFLPGEAIGSGVPADPINFSWGDKIAPRLGAAWDVFRDGKMKVFGSYGVFYDQMKLNLAISSFGGQYWQNCVYGLNDPNLSDINLVFNSNHRFCVGQSSSSGANFAGGTAPEGLSFIENVNFRASIVTCGTCNPYEEAVAPNLKPYRQHEAVGGVDYQISRNVSFEARYDRRRLDHVIEDSAIDNTSVGETFVIVNPGQGVNSTFNGFCNFLYSQIVGNNFCTSPTGAYPPNQTIPAARSYDGLEIRLNKALSSHWFGLFSYTYSHFRGNYTGLTSSDIADGGSGGRNSPNNSRSFDEPYFSYNSMGGSSSGLLPTDRPNTLKGYAYYQLGFLKKFTTNLGIFQTMYQGSPNTTYMDIAESYNAFPVDIFNRGVWANITQDPSTGTVTVGTPHVYRNPWYNQTDFNFEQSYKISESKVVSFTSTFSNLLNQHAVTAVNEQVDSSYNGGAQFGVPVQGQYFGNPALKSVIPVYAAIMSPYNVSQVLNIDNVNYTGTERSGPITINSQYGKPLYYQQPRTIRLGAKFTF